MRSLQRNILHFESLRQIFDHLPSLWIFAHSRFSMRAINFTLKKFVKEFCITFTKKFQNQKVSSESQSKKSIESQGWPWVLVLC